jgi:glycosyltransferase involved in cell wall biosynthesis
VATANDRPKVSIGIPAYARPAELERAIRSVLDQGVDGVEVVVGDDSGDLEVVVRAIDDPRVVYVRNDPRLGMAENWNAVLDRARGEYVGLLMDDDALLPGFLDAVLEPLSSMPDVGLACTDHVFSDGTRTWGRDCALAPGRHDASVFTMLDQQPVAVSAAVMRREVWEAIRPLPDLLTADLVMHVRVALAGYPIFYVDRPLMVYAVHAGQQSVASPRFRQDQVTAWEMFSFDEPRAEQLRRGRLAGARVSLGAAQLAAGDYPGARATLRAAREFGLRTAGAKSVALSVAAFQPAVGRLVTRLWPRRSAR